jgi:hypothetical protein
MVLSVREYLGVYKHSLRLPSYIQLEGAGGIHRPIRAADATEAQRPSASCNEADNELDTLFRT